MWIHDGFMIFALERVWSVDALSAVKMSVVIDPFLLNFIVKRKMKSPSGVSKILRESRESNQDVTLLS